MTVEEAIEVLDMFLDKQCDLERTKFAYDENTVWSAVQMGRDALKERNQRMIVLSPDLTDEQVRELFERYCTLQPTVIGAHITDVDLMELRDRFGKEVADVVADMISGGEKRWHNEQTK